MKIPSIYILPSPHERLFFFVLRASSPANHPHESFVRCLSYQSPYNTSVPKLIYAPTNPSYSSILNFSVQNLRFTSSSTPKPQAIFTPVDESQIKAAIYCSKKHGLEFRVRSGGHDFEGQSYIAKGAPFVLVDLFNLRSIDIDVETATAWVQAGATQGEVYYTIANKSRTLGFPGGAIPSLGVGGLISGGGFGMLARKCGVAADTVIGARFMDANGNILDRKSMGEDLFWAIRGGGGGNFGVVLAWKLKLVSVPEKVTVFTIQKTLAQNATDLAHKWQQVAHRFDKDMFIRIRFRRVNSTVQASFQSLFLGGIERLLAIMRESFPELGLVREDCNETSWIRSVLYFGGYRMEGPLEVLLDRKYHGDIYFKARSDYVKKPIPREGIEGLLKLLLEQKPGLGDIVWSPYGVRMEEIPESEIAYPHRAGNLYEIYEAVYWHERGTEAARKPLKWVKKLYSYLTPYVSKSPRAGYVNHRDLDLGVTGKNTTPEEARAWGVKYYLKNYDRLVRVKTSVDPNNFFRNEQSIPPLVPIY